MPGFPAKTPQLGLPRLGPEDDTAIWEHHNNLADGIDGLFRPWSTYKPVWTQSNGTLLNVGSGSLTGRYMQLGKLVMGYIRLIRAADSNKGAGSWIFSLPPVTPWSWNTTSGSMAMTRNGVHFAGSVFPASSTTIGCIAGDLGRVSNTIPLAEHADGDWCTLSFTYEAA